MFVKGRHNVLSSHVFSPSDFRQASLASFSSALLIGSFMVIKPSPVSFIPLLDRTRHFIVLDQLWNPSSFLPWRSKPSQTK